MSKFLSEIKKSTEPLSQAITTASKLSIPVGVLIILLYSSKNNFFPLSLSVSDGLLFILIALCFGVFYTFFVLSLVSLGISMSPIIRPLFNLFLKIHSKITKCHDKPVHKLAPFDGGAALFAIFAIIFILTFGSNDSSVYWNLPLLSIVLYFLYSLFLSFGNVISGGQEVSNANKIKDGPEVARRIILVFILILPLFLSGVFGQFMDATMRFTHIRVEHPLTYIKEPYSSLLPGSLISKDRNALKGYTAYTDTIVLFRGFGNATVIRFRDENTIRQLEIPNDSIFIENIRKLH